jgi:hypothetical protein
MGIKTRLLHPSKTAAYSITCSAMASSKGGTDSPIALAALRLITRPAPAAMLAPDGLVLPVFGGFAPSR